MSQILYFEDIFIKFYNHDDIINLGIQSQDRSAMESFYLKLSSNESLTQNQANYVIKLLEKYKKLSSMTGFDYEDWLKDAKWKNTFRVLDLSKKVYVEQGKNGGLEICLKFPFQLKNEFEKEIDSYANAFTKFSYWDPENRVRRLSFYDFNLVSIYEFACKHGFEIDESFMCAMADIEEIWQNEEKIKPHCIISSNLVIPKNYLLENYSWLSAKLSLDQDNQLLLLKSMGFVFDGVADTMIKKIAASSHNTFWIRSLSSLLSIIKTIDGKIAIVIDRSSDVIDWLKNFIQVASDNGVPVEQIKVCFRENKDEDTGLNNWIKETGVGGKIDAGRIFIFQHKPAKWLFKDNVDIKMIVTNNLYPHTSQITKDWLESHPCVIYVGDIKPSEYKGRKIVEL